MSDRDGDQSPHDPAAEVKGTSSVMFWYDHNLSAWGWIGMTVGMVAFWALVIGVVVWLVRGLDRRDHPGTPQSPGPEQLLAERFARGEIDETEYRDRLNTLRAGPHPAVRP